MVKKILGFGIIAAAAFLLMVVVAGMGMMGDGISDGDSLSPQMQEKIPFHLDNEGGIECKVIRSGPPRRGGHVHPSGGGLV